MITGIMDAGGGLRGIYAAGVFDYCMDQKIAFDLCIGVSAGSANIVSYAAGQSKRNYQFYTQYSFRRKYMSLWNYITKKSFIDLDYIYGTLSNSDGENPLDFQALHDNPADLLVVATEAQTGRVHYFNKDDLRQDDYGILKASSALPVVCHPYEVNGTLYFDGALGDPVPIQKAFDCGCDKVVVVLTKPENTLRTAEKDERIASRLAKHYPKAAERLRQRAENYNQSVALAQEYAQQGKAVIISPDNTCGVDTLTRNKTSLWMLYEKGCRDAEKISAFLHAEG